MRDKRHRIPALTLALAALAACPPASERAGSSADPSSAVKVGKRDVVVATIGQRKITAGELSDELQRQNPYVRMRFASLERKKAFLQNLIRFEVLVREAERRGLGKDPEVQRRVKRAMVERLMATMKKELVKFSDISDADVKAYYEQHKDNYQRPAEVRASQIVVPDLRTARKLLGLLKAKRKDPRYFAQLVAEHSVDQATKSKRGSLGFFRRDTESVPKAIVEAAFKIPRRWEIAGPIKLGKGYALVMKTGFRAALNRPLSVVRDRIKNRLYNKRRQEALKAYVEKLQKRAKIEIDEKNLAAVKVDKGRPKPGKAR